MTKKYRFKGTKDNFVIIHTEDGPSKERPVVYSYTTRGDWFAASTSPLGHDLCPIEEVPEVTVEVGDVFQREGPYGVEKAIIYQVEEGRAALFWMTGQYYDTSFAVDGCSIDTLRKHFLKVGKIVYDN